jgi:hypothetical protein
MSPDEAGGRLLCILPEINGAAASIDGAAIIAEAVAPCSGERSQLVNSIKTPTEANCCRWHHLRQRQTVYPELNDRGQLGPGSHGRQLCNHLIEVRGDAPGDEKPQPVSKTIQFARPIRDGEREWSAQRLWQISKNPDSQVIDLFFCRLLSLSLPRVRRGDAPKARRPALQNRPQYLQEGISAFSACFRLYRRKSRLPYRRRNVGLTNP